MITRNYLFILAIFFQFQGYAQLGHVSNWPLGYGNSTDSSYGGSMVSFNSGAPVASYFNIQIAYTAENANISDVNGNLIAYTNGCQIQNREHSMMENGDNINPGIFHQQQCSDASGYSNDQGAIFLPLPGSDSLYYLFHLKSFNTTVAKQLLYTIMDASANNGLGRILDKNQFLEEDTLTGLISAVRHANGRDWWLIIQKNFNLFNTPLPTGAIGKYHLYLFDTYGIHAQGEQTIGQFWTPQNWSGQAAISPDGSKYAIGNRYNGINFFDFDRCTGTLSNPIHLNFSSDTTFAVGVAFSPNSRFLYATTGLLILQFDLLASSIESSKQIVAQYDGYQSILPTTFFQLALAPDGKIYGTATNATNILHIIHAPDNPGLNCQVEQHGFQATTFHKFTIPNFPHYNLYDVEGSTCDSLGIDGPTTGTELPTRIDQIVFYPNPTKGEFFWNFEEHGDVLLTVHNQMGCIVFSQVLSDGKADLHMLPNGLYFLKFYTLSNKKVFTKRICIIQK